MPAPFSITLGGSQFPWARGLNTARRPAELAPNEAQTATNIDLTAGTLRGSWGPGTAIAQTVSVGAKFIHCASGTDWISSVYAEWACGIAVYASTSQAIYTQHTSATTYSYPLIRSSGASYRLGLPTPGTGMTAAGGARAARSYAVVFINSEFQIAGGFQYSNPSSIVTTTSGATLSSIPTPSTPTAYTSSPFSYLQTLVYATEEGDPNGTLYYYETLTNGTTSWTDTGGNLGGYAVDTKQPLDWGANGSIDSATTPKDYTQQSGLAVLAEELYGGQGSAGILFGAKGYDTSSNNLVVWSHTGKPWAWPAVNFHDVQESVEALVVWQGSVYAFTGNSVWSFSGGADYAITPVRMSAAYPLKAGFGKTAKASPFGIFYVAREGIALFDGVSSRIITKGILDPTTFLGGAAYGNAAYYDGSYRLNLWGTGVMLIVEVDAEGGVRVTKSTTVNASDLHVTTRSSSNQGLFIANYTTGALTPWRPADGSAVTGASRSTWAWASPLLTIDAPGRLKRFNRMRVACALNGGSLAVQVDMYDVNGSVPAGWSPTTFTKTITDAQSALFWLPAGLCGQAATVTLAPSSGNVEVYEVALEGEVFNGA